MGKSYKTKLNITSNKQLSLLKKMAGCYRVMYNACLEVQALKRLPRYSNSIKDCFFTGTELLNLMRKVKKKFDYLNQVDGGIFTAAVFNASKAFLAAYRWETPEYLSRKKDLPKFKSCGQIKVFYDYITIPKFGKVKLFEKGYLPQGKKYSNITFSYDGNDWWVSLVVDEPSTIPTDVNKGTSMTADFDSEGNLYINDKVISNVVNEDNYQKELKKLKKLTKKLRRQAKVNTIRRVASNDVQATKGKVKTTKAINKVKTRLSNIKKDYFKKMAYEVARTKPEQLHVLSSVTIGTERNGYLSRKLRESSTKEFFNILIKKLKFSGTKVTRHLFSEELVALGSRVPIACGGLSSSTPECKSDQLVEAGIAFRQRAEVDENGNRKPKEAEQLQ